MGTIATAQIDNRTPKKEDVVNSSIIGGTMNMTAAMLSGIGDGAIKINQAVPGYFDKNSLRDLTGIEPAKVDDND